MPPPPSLLSLLLGGAAAHSSLLFPPSRNSIDKLLAPWANGSFGHDQYPDGWGCDCVNGTAPCEVGQSCYWFSQGCTIGCARCVDVGANPNTEDLCNSSTPATVNAPEHRTFNRDVEAGSDADVYKHNPWRAPGLAPVYDACGMAGGAPTAHAGEGQYATTVYARQGDYGSALPPMPSGVVWRGGDRVEAKWSVRANHGGGYQYRLCALERNLTEACFQETPVGFARHTQLEWANGTRLTIASTYVEDGVLPVGSTWAMNPLPYSNTASPPEFEPPCDELPWPYGDVGLCSGRDPYDVAIVDTLVVPDVAAGDYVLGFRWDCEKSAQIWQSCADITITLS